MPQKSLERLTESMFYVLMALTRQEFCGIDIAAWIDCKTQGRIRMGPATLYTILGKFQQEGFILETEVSGRKRTYRITDKGRSAYQGELERLKLCILDAETPERRNLDGTQSLPLSPSTLPSL